MKKRTLNLTRSEHFVDKPGWPDIDVVPLDSLRTDERNANLGTARGRRHLKRSLQDFGAARSLVVDKNLLTLAGNQTLNQAKRLGMDRVVLVKTTGDVLVAVQRVDLDAQKDEKAIKLAIADNRTNELNLFWNLETLKNIGIDLGEFWNDKELQALGLINQIPSLQGPLARLDLAAEYQKKWQTAPGQLWTVGDHRLLCGNCVSEADVKRLMNGCQGSLFSTDPPYGLGYDGMNHPQDWTGTERRKQQKNKNWRSKYEDFDKPDSVIALYDGFIKTAIKCAIREDAAWYTWHASRNQAMLEGVWNRHGAFVHQKIIWVKDRPILTRSWWMWGHEPCFFGWRRPHKPQRVADDHLSTVWTFPTIAPGVTTAHPTQKPIELFAIPIRQHTVKGEIVYEPFAGSGTQLVAAQLLGRVCYAIEKNPEFVAVALERLSEMNLQPKLLERISR